MTAPIRIAAAGNTLAPALAILRKQGFEVSRIPGTADNEALFSATRGTTTLVAEDLLALLGLASIEMHRGVHWRPSDAEVDDLLSVMGQL